MLSAVSARDPFSGALRAATGPSGPAALTFPRPGAPSRPFQPVPAPPPLRARPGKQTNQNVPYQRALASHPDARDGSSWEARHGDLMFVSRTSRLLTREPFLSKATTFANVRRELAKTPMVVGAGAAASAVFDARLEEYEAALEELRDYRQQDCDDFVNLDVVIAGIETIIARHRANRAAVETVLATGGAAWLAPFFDRAAFPFLEDWSPDGLLMRMDRTDDDSEGLCVNVSVSGPAFMRVDKEDQPVEGALGAGVRLFLVLMPEKSPPDSSGKFLFEGVSARIFTEDRLKLGESEIVDAYSLGRVMETTRDGAVVNFHVVRLSFVALGRLADADWNEDHFKCP
jgi:hypothetical protein